MKFFQLFRKELKLLSNNKSKPAIILTSLLGRRTAFLIPGSRMLWWAGLIFILIFVIPSCRNKEEKEQKPSFSFNDSSMVTKETKKILGDNLKFILTGNFDKDSLQEIAAGIELTENNNWGIKFILLELADNQLNYDLIYYNSQDYFWGSGGGEVFSYLINFAENKTYYTHLFSESRKPAELFLSKNITDSEIRKFFISNFKKDYPDLKLASEDVSLEF